MEIIYYSILNSRSKGLVLKQWRLSQLKGREHIRNCYCWRRWVFVRKSLPRRKRLCCWENLFFKRKLKLDHGKTGGPLCLKLWWGWIQRFPLEKSWKLELPTYKSQILRIRDCWGRSYQWWLAKSKELVRTYVLITWELLKNQLLRIIGISTWTYIVDFCKALIRIR